eukprot:scaffold2.g7206.t1
MDSLAAKRPATAQQPATAQRPPASGSTTALRHVAGRVPTPRGGEGHQLAEQHEEGMDRAPQATASYTHKPTPRPRTHVAPVLEAVDEAGAAELAAPPPGASRRGTQFGAVSARGPGSLYTRLKSMRPRMEQEQLDEAEVFWAGDEEGNELEERRQQLLRQQQEEELLERLKRHAGVETGNTSARAQSASQQATPTASSRQEQAAMLLAAGPTSALACPAGSWKQQAGEAEPAAEDSSASGKAQSVVARLRAAYALHVQPALAQLMSHPDTQALVIALIAANCVILALYDPLQTDGAGRNAILKDVETAINVCFSLEILLSCLAAGGLHALLRASAWNAFDLAMVVVGFLSYLPTGSSGAAGAVRALRALRALRPLRSITRFQSLRQIVVCFLEAVPMLSHVLSLLLFFVLFFSICATLLFNTAYEWKCIDPVTGAMEPDPGGDDEWGCGHRSCPAPMACTNTQPQPPYAVAGFSNTGLSFLSMFQIMTQTDAFSAISRVADRAGVVSVFFFILFMIIQANFISSLVLAVLKNKFVRASTLMSKVCQETSVGSAPGPPPPPTELDVPPSGLRAKAAWYWIELRWHVRQVVESNLFGAFFMLAILANTVLLAMTTADMPPARGAALDRGNQVMTVLFTVELVLKLAGLGLWGYAADWSNLGDGVLVVMGLVELIGSVAISGNAMRSFRTLRILRSFRVLRLLKVRPTHCCWDLITKCSPNFNAVVLTPPALKVFRFLDSLRVVATVLISSMSSFFAISGLMTLWQAHASRACTACAAACLMHVFGGLALDPAYPNFDSFVNAFVMVFQALTLENWPSLMFAVQEAAGWPATIYFVAWMLLGRYVLLQLCFEVEYERAQRSSTGTMTERVRSWFINVRAWLAGMWLKLRWRAPRGRARPDLDAALREQSEPMLGAARAQAWAAGSEPPPESPRQPADLGGDVFASLAAAPQLREVGNTGQPVPTSAADAAEQPSEPAEQHQAKQAKLEQARTVAGKDGGGAVKALIRRFEQKEQLHASLAASTADAPWAGDGAAEDSEAAPVAKPSAAQGNEPASAACQLKSTRRISRWHSRHARFAESPPEEFLITARVRRAGSTVSDLVEESSSDDEPEDGTAAGEVAGGQQPPGGSRSASPRPPASRVPSACSSMATAGSSFTHPGSGMLRRTASQLSGVSGSLADELADADRLSGFSGISGASSSVASRISALARRRTKRKDYPPLAGTSLWLFAVGPGTVGERVVLFGLVDNPVRARIYFLCTLHWFDWFLMLVVLLSCVGMALETAGMDPASPKARALWAIDVSTTCLFWVELALKVVAFGWRAYISFFTNKLDCVVVVVSTVVLVAQMLNARFLRALRVLRAVRPLRVLTRSTATLMVFHTLADCVGTFADPETGALTYMTMSSSRATRDMQPHMGTNPIAFVFWFAFISLATFFVINLYVGVVFYQFTRLQMLSQTGSAVLTSAQTGYVELLKAVFRLRRVERRRAGHASAWGASAAKQQGNSEMQGSPTAKEACNTAFSTIIVGELAIKLAAMGPCMYWRSHWNKFDAALCVTALADLITQLLNAALGGVVNLGAVRRVLMLARILRAFKFVRHVKGIQSLLATLVLSLPAVFNVACLLFLAFFIYSNAGMLLFGNVVWQDSINEHANFSTFPRALFLLYRVSTGDNYVGVMRDCMVRPPDCDSAAGNCGSLAAPLFFFSFYLSVGLIAFQLVITIILDSFEKVVEQEQWQLTTDDLARFCSLWAEYDDGCNRIEPSSLEELLTRLPPPMGLGALATNNDILRFVFSLDIPLDDDGMVPFHRTAFELVQRCTRTQIPEASWHVGCRQNTQRTM